MIKLGQLYDPIPRPVALRATAQTAPSMFECAPTPHKETTGRELTPFSNSLQVLIPNPWPVPNKRLFLKKTGAAVQLHHGRRAQRSASRCAIEAAHRVVRQGDVVVGEVRHEFDAVGTQPRGCRRMIYGCSTNTTASIGSPVLYAQI